MANVLDASQIWVVLIATGIAAGLVAAAIDIVANWLGGLKEGYCTTSFYLSKEFCCWGLDAADTCKDWAWWSQALKVDGNKVGKYVVEYTFYILFSVCRWMARPDGGYANWNTDSLRYQCQPTRQELCPVRTPQWYSGDQNSPGGIRDTAISGRMDAGDQVGRAGMLDPFRGLDFIWLIADSVWLSLPGCG